MVLPLSNTERERLSKEDDILREHIQTEYMRIWRGSYTCECGKKLKLLYQNNVSHMNTHKKSNRHKKFVLDQNR